MRQRVDLIIIDPQNDFVHPLGSLSVPGALADMKRLALMINRLGTKITRIHVTMDSHRTLHIAHPCMWVDKKGNHPNPFTLITTADVEAGIWQAAFPPFQKRMAQYVHDVENNKRYVVCIWPPHCLIGHPGHSVFNGEDAILNMPRDKKAREKLFSEINQMVIANDERLLDALDAWESKMMYPVNYVTKGSNMFTEHYSAVLADVPDPRDPSTQLNTPFIETTEEADVIIFSGEAGSHCLKNTAEDMFNKFGADSLKKVILLTDATSSVPGFENLYDEFVKKYVPMGMTLTTTKEFGL